MQFLRHQLTPTITQSRIGRLAVGAGDLIALLCELAAAQRRSAASRP